MKHIIYQIKFNLLITLLTFIYVSMNGFDILVYISIFYIGLSFIYTLGGIEVYKIANKGGKCTFHEDELKSTKLDYESLKHYGTYKGK